MDELLLTIIFLFPGLIIKSAEDYLLKKRKNREGNAYEYVFGVVVHGIIVSAAVICTMNFLLPRQFGFDSFSKLIEDIDQFSFALTYGALAIAFCGIWGAAYHWLVKKALQKLKGEFLHKTAGITSIDSTTVYEKIFRDPKNKNRLIPVGIFKQGELVVCGTLKNWNSPNFDLMEFKLEHTLEIAEIMENDKRSEHEILNTVRFEYYVPEYDILIKFYGRSELEKYWLDKYGSANRPQ